jgi:hypothetical protein
LWRRLTAALMGVFGLIALLLGGIGVYGTAAQAVAARRTEFGTWLRATKRQVLLSRSARASSLPESGRAGGLVYVDLLADLPIKSAELVAFAAACAILGLTGYWRAICPR